MRSTPPDRRPNSASAPAMPAEPGVPAEAVAAARPFFGIRARLIALVVAAVAPLILLIGFGAKEQIDRERAAVLGQAEVLARLVAAQIDDRLGNVDALLVGLSQGISANPADLAANEAPLRESGQALGKLSAVIAAFTPEGIPLGASDGRSGPVDVGVREFRRAAAAPGIYVGEPRRSGPGDPWTVTLVRQVPGGAGRPVALVSATIGLARLLESTGADVVPAGSLITVVDEEQLIVMRSQEPEKWIGQKRFDNPAVSEALRVRDGSFEFRNAAGARRLAGFSTCARAPWMVFARIANEEPFAAAEAQRRRAVLFGGAAIAATLVLAWFMASRITRPLRQLSADADAVAAGRLIRPSTVSTGGEVGRLAGVFNQMLATLEHRDSALRQSEARYRRLIDSAPEAIVVLDVVTGKFVDHNPPAEALFQMTTAELREVGPAEVSPPRQPDGRPSAEAAGEFVRAAVEGGIPVFEWTHRDRHGRELPCEIRLLRLPGDAPVLIRGSIADITARRLVQDQLAHERAVLERLARDTSLEEVLTALVVGHEAFFPGTLGSVLLLDAEGKRLGRGVAPHLPAAYNRAVDGGVIGFNVGSCGTAAFTGQTVVVSDIATDPRWADHRGLALAHGLRACWSTPLLSGQGKVLGTFALYYRETREPQPQELAAVASGARLASLAIERRRMEDERLDFERKLQATQKLESLGVLAGGIAHDFNNILTGILGNASLASLELPAGSAAQANLDSIKQGSLRAADLCKQMLAYSGRGRFVVQALDLNALVEETTHLLQISISKQAVLRFNLYAGLPLIEADATQIRQVIMNLVINASEAIGEKSGVISIGTGLTRADRTYLGGTILAPELPEGSYVYLEVSDTGCGMSAETQAKIFEPFFTTKFTGRGLGLAAVLGIMRGHRGALKIYSEPGRGTTFKLLLPCAGAGAGGAGAPEAVAPVWRGEGCVLVVDDEESVRTTAAQMLRKLGFEAALVADGREAVTVYAADPGRYVLVLMDLTMPRLGGEQTFTELRRLRPDVRVLLMSGFNEQEAVARFTGKGLAGFLQKPFQIEGLSGALQKVWGAVPGEPAT